MTQTIRAVKRTTNLGLTTAVHRSKPLSRAGMLERMFTLAFSGLVYPQIWEDPVVDMEALALQPSDHLVAIASGSCNILSYLTADPAKVSAIDLNGAHIALGHLKLAALAEIDDHAIFRRFFGQAQSKANVETYDRLDRTAARRGQPAPIGRDATSPAGAGSRSSPAISTATACSAASSGPGISSPAGSASTHG